MKLRTLLAVGAVGMASAAFATGTVNSENTFGILALPDTTSTNLIISIPWVDCTDASQGTLVSNVVKTTNLTEGDYIIRKSGDTYQGWQLTKAANDVLYWNPAVIVDGKVTTTTDGANTARMTRGDALWLHRADPANSSPIYLFGQYSAAEATSTIAAGATTMVANPGTSDLKISLLCNNGVYTKFTSGSPANGDKVMVNTASGYKTYTFNGSAWTKKTTASSSPTPALPGGQTPSVAQTVAVTDSDVIPAGKGFWYQSKTGAGTITW